MSDPSTPSLPPATKLHSSQRHGRHSSVLSTLSNSSNSSNASSPPPKKTTWKRVVSPVSGSSASTRSSGKDSGSTNRTSVSPPGTVSALKSSVGSLKVKKDIDLSNSTNGRKRVLSLRKSTNKMSEGVKERNQRILDSLNSSSSDNLPPPLSRNSTDSTTSTSSSLNYIPSSRTERDHDTGFSARSPSPQKVGSVRRKHATRDSTGGAEAFASKRNSVVDLFSVSGPSRQNFDATSDLITPKKGKIMSFEDDDEDTPKSGPRTFEISSTMRRVVPDGGFSTPSTVYAGPGGVELKRARTGESKTMGYRNRAGMSMDLKRTRDLHALSLENDVPLSAPGPVRSFTSLSQYSHEERPHTTEFGRRSDSRTSSRGGNDLEEKGRSRRYSESLRASLDFPSSRKNGKSPPPPLPSTRARPRLPEYWDDAGSSFPSSATTPRGTNEWEEIPSLTRGSIRRRSVVGKDEAQYELVGDGELGRPERVEHARPPSLSKRTGELFPSRRAGSGGGSVRGDDEDLTVSSGGFSGGRKSLGASGSGSLDGYRSRTASLLGGRSSGSGGGSYQIVERTRKISATSIGSGSGRFGRLGDDEGRFPRSPRAVRSKGSYSPTTVSSQSLNKRYSTISEDVMGRRHERFQRSQDNEDLLSELKELRERVNTLEKRPQSRSGHSSNAGSSDAALREPFRLNSSTGSRDSRDRERTLRRSLNSTDSDFDPPPFSASALDTMGSIRRRGLMSSPTESRPTESRPTESRPSSGFGRDSRNEGMKSRNSGVFDVKEHHKLLHDSLSYFETHFSTLINGAKEDQLPESADLIKRMSAIVTATSKLNTGLRNLVIAANDAQVEAELDESGTGSSVRSLIAFEKNTNQLLRISDDQVRSLTEGLIAFTRADRERQRRLKENSLGLGTPSSSRPISRADSANGRRSITPSSPQKRSTVTPSPANDGQFTFPSLSGSSRGNKAAPPLRDPLEGLDKDDSPTLARATSAGARILNRFSPLNSGSIDSPSPVGGLGRSESLRIKSPLGHSKNNSLEDPDIVRPIVRRAKTSSTSQTTVRGANNQSAPPHLVRSPQTSDPATINETADTTRSPTHDSNYAGLAGRSRTISDAALEPLIEQQEEKDFLSRRHTLSSGTGRLLAALTSEDGDALSTPAGKDPRKRMSTGAGAASALRQGLSGIMSGRKRGNTIDRENVAEGSPSHGSSASMSYSPSTSSLAQRSAERRKEVEAILRKTVGKSSNK